MRSDYYEIEIHVEKNSPTNKALDILYQNTSVISVGEDECT